MANKNTNKVINAKTSKPTVDAKPTVDSKPVKIEGETKTVKPAAVSKTEKPADDSFKFEEEFEKKIKLSDGSEEYMYSRGPKISDDFWPIQCFVCRVGRINNEKSFQNHLKYQKHVENLEKAIKEPPNAEEFRQPYEQAYSDRFNFKNPITIYPGEVIGELTTDYADRLVKIKEYAWDMPPAEGYLDILKSDIIMDYNKKSPILGLCYGFKMANDKTVSYYCGLCETELTELNAYQHFSGKDHFNKYVENHFAQTMEKLENIQGITDDQKTTIIRSIYQKLENWKGHRPFYLVNGKGFQATKDRFVQRAKRIYHYSDTTILFSETELKDMFEKIKKRQLIVPTNPERLMKQPKTEKEMTQLPVDVEEEMPNIEEITKKDSGNKQDNKEKQKKTRKRKNKNKNKSDEPENKMKKDEPKQKQEKVELKRKLKLDESPANWEKYRNLCQRAIQSLNAEYERFAAVSERHPKYQEEWRRFYKNKTENLRRERINPNNYNFKPEWNVYWMRYLELCFKKDAGKCKFEFRKNLKLPYRGSTPEPPNVFEGCNFNSNIGQKPNSSNNIFNANNSGSVDGIKFGSLDNNNTSRTQSGPVPLMSVGSIFGGFDGGIKNQIQPPSLPMIQQQPQQQQQQQLQQQNFPPQKLQQQQQPQIQQQGQQEQQNVANNPNPDNNAPTSVLSVLRLLTALENELGSLGPTANQLLGKAILYEKESKQSANELLHETEYYSLFATSLEKLKGLLTTGLIPDLKVRVTKACTSDLEKIINLFEEYLRRNPEATKNHISSNIVLRKHQLPTSADSTNQSSLSMNNSNNMSSNDNYNAKSEIQRPGQNMGNNENTVSKWNPAQNSSNNTKWNDDGLKQGGVGNQSNARNVGNNNNFERPNVPQRGRGNFDNNSMQSLNSANRQGNLQNPDYNSSRNGNDYQNQRNSMNSQWNNNSNFNSRNSGNDYNTNHQRNPGNDFNTGNQRSTGMSGNNFTQDRGGNVKNFDRNDFTNNQRSDNRFNSMQRDTGNLMNNQRNETNSFNQNNQRNSTNNNRRDDRDLFNRNGDNFNQRNSGYEFNNQRNTGNFDSNQRNLGNNMQGNWNSSNQPSNFNDSQSKNLPSLLNNNFRGSGNNSSIGNFGGRGFIGRR